MKAADATEEIPALSLGSIVGGSTLANKPWSAAIRDLGIRIREARGDIGALLNLNVVFHVPGNMLKPEFVGVRTGRYSKQMAVLMVQVAVPEEVPADPVIYLKSTIHAAIDEAERWALKRKVPMDAAKLRSIVERV